MISDANSFIRHTLDRTSKRSFFKSCMQIAKVLHPVKMGKRPVHSIQPSLDTSLPTYILFRYIIAITDLLNITSLQSGSKVIHGTGEAEFTLHYQALVMKPMKGEVVDCSVEKVGKLGFFCLLGPMQIFVSTHVSIRPNRSVLFPKPLLVLVARRSVGVRMMTRKHRDILPSGLMQTYG
jgi:DNA-directed RNA polymerase subunit E'/Rpb7